MGRDRDRDRAGFLVEWGDLCLAVGLWGIVGSREEEASTEITGWGKGAAQRQEERRHRPLKGMQRALPPLAPVWEEPRPSCLFFCTASWGVGTRHPPSKLSCRMTPSPDFKNNPTRVTAASGLANTCRGQSVTGSARLGCYLTVRR